jgi:hypothetical protein
VPVSVNSVAVRDTVSQEGIAVELYPHTPPLNLVTVYATVWPTAHVGCGGVENVATEQTVPPLHLNIF